MNKLLFFFVIFTALLIKNTETMLMRKLNDRKLGKEDAKKVGL